MQIKTFGVIGAGQMGAGIAQVAAMSGLNVIMNDIKTEFVDKGLANIAKILSRGVEKGKMSEEEKKAVLGRIKTSIALGLTGTVNIQKLKIFSFTPVATVLC